MAKTSKQPATLVANPSIATIYRVGDQEFTDLEAANKHAAACSIEGNIATLAKLVNGKTGPRKRAEVAPGVLHLIGLASHDKEVADSIMRILELAHGPAPTIAAPALAEAPKKRGRKPKQVEPATASSPTPATPAEAPKKRGRKPKQVEPAVAATPAEAPKKRGRKPKQVETGTPTSPATGDEAPKKKRGRPAKVHPPAQVAPPIPAPATQPDLVDLSTLTPPPLPGQ